MSRIVRIRSEGETLHADLYGEMAGRYAETSAEWQREEREPFTGWDFSHLAGRWHEEHPPWSYEEMARSLLRTSVAALDLGTGGGERLAAMADAFPVRVAATEGYTPNAEIARGRLAPLGVEVVGVGSGTDLPFPDRSFDVVLDRHTAFDADEVARVLRPGGAFLTQQVEGCNLADLIERFGGTPAVPSHQPRSADLRAPHHWVRHRRPAGPRPRHALRRHRRTRLLPPRRPVDPARVLGRDAPARTTCAPGAARRRRAADLHLAPDPHPRELGTGVIEEQPLGGGRSTTVSRVGDTVRRGTGPWTPTVHAYLRHLRAAGFIGAPEVLGLDETGREVLSFIEGTTMGETLDPHEPKAEFVTVRPWPTGATSDRALAGIGRLVRGMHDAARGFRPVAPIWREYDSPMQPDEIVTHGDIGPWNVVYRGGDPVTIIDFDGARPQRPLFDLAWTAWHCVPLGEDTHLRASGFTAPYRRGERLRILTDAYRLKDRSGLLDALSEVKQRWPAVIRYWQPLRSSVAAQHLRFCADDLDWLERNREDLAAHLR